MGREILSLEAMKRACEISPAELIEKVSHSSRFHSAVGEAYRCMPEKDNVEFRNRKVFLDSYVNEHREHLLLPDEIMGHLVENVDSIERSLSSRFHRLVGTAYHRILINDLPDFEKYIDILGGHVDQHGERLLFSNEIMDRLVTLGDKKWEEFEL